MGYLLMPTRRKTDAGVWAARIGIALSLALCVGSMAIAAWVATW